MILLAPLDGQQVRDMMSDICALLWKAAGMIEKGFVLALTGKAADSPQIRR
jgi:hypothetical protein